VSYLLFQKNKMKENKQAIVLKIYDLNKEVIPLLNSLPKSYKFSIGDRIQSHLLDLMELLIEAVYLPSKEKIPILKKVNLQLEKLRFLFRLLADFKCISYKKHLYFVEKLNEIGRMTGGWIKSLR